MSYSLVALSSILSESAEKNLSRLRYVLTRLSAGASLGRMVLPEPNQRFGDKEMLLLYSVVSCGVHLVVRLVPKIVAYATTLGVRGLSLGLLFQL